jgi:hypothetical protein
MGAHPARSALHENALEVAAGIPSFSHALLTDPRGGTDMFTRVTYSEAPRTRWMRATNSPCGSPKRAELRPRRIEVGS